MQDQREQQDARRDDGRKNRRAVGGPADDRYRIVIEPLAGRVVARFAGATLADTTDAKILHETNLPSVIFVPRADVALEHLQAIDLQTFCPFKGNATHWRLTVAERTVEPAAWSYETPLAEADPIAGHIAFYPEAIHEWTRDGETLHAMTPLRTERHPLTDWLLLSAGDCASPEELTAQLGQKLIAAGVPLWRISVAIWTLHPQLAGTTYTWRSDREGVAQVYTPHGALESPGYLNSPVKFVTDGLGGVRQRLDTGEPRYPFPVMNDLKAEGATDYVAMPLPFSDGSIHSMTLTSRDADGFSTSDLGMVFENSVVISRLYEVHTLRANTAVLLNTYLGKRTGARVREGQTRRGDGERLKAVIFMADLRGSTALAERLSREDYLDVLSCFFDCTATPVTERGGEVLKLIGDAVLAIFPLPDAIDDAAAEAAAAAVCRRAHTAARDSLRRIETANRTGGLPAEIRCAVALHLGELTYGNVGSQDRLDFTIVGTAVNETARLDAVAKKLDEPAVYSGDVGKHLGDAARSLGNHALPGVGREIEIFVPVEAGGGAD